MYITNSIPYIIYFLLCVLLFLGSTTKYCSIKAEQLYITLFRKTFFIAISFFFLGCRGFIGADWLLYLPYYDSVPTFYYYSLKDIWIFINHNNYERLYALMNIVLKSICNNYFFFQFFLFLIDFSILHFFFKEYLGKYYYLGWAFFYIFQGYILEIIILRNAKSIMIFLISIKYINKKKPLKYLLINLVGLLFHSSALIYFPLYFLVYIPRKKVFELIIFIIGNIIYITQLQWFKSFFYLIQPILPSKISYVCDLYFNHSHYAVAYGITIGYIERFASFILIYYFADELIKQDGRMKFFIQLFFIYSYIYLYFTEFYIFIERVPTLFVCCYWILYPKIYGQIKKDWKYVYIIIFVLYGILKTIILLDEKWALYDNFILGSYSAAYRAEHLTY